MKNVGLLLFFAAGLGCATQKFGFRPTGSVMTAEAGYPASHYAVPPQSPRGEGVEIRGLDDGVTGAAHVARAHLIGDDTQKVWSCWHGGFGRGGRP